MIRALKDQEMVCASSCPTLTQIALTSLQNATDHAPRNAITVTTASETARHHPEVAAAAEDEAVAAAAAAEATAPLNSPTAIPTHPAAPATDRPPTPLLLPETGSGDHNKTVCQRKGNPPKLPRWIWRKLRPRMKMKKLQCRG